MRFLGSPGRSAVEIEIMGLAVSLPSNNPSVLQLAAARLEAI